MTLHISENIAVRGGLSFPLYAMPPNRIVLDVEAQ